MLLAPPSCDNQNVYRRCQLGHRGQNHSQLRPTELDPRSSCLVELIPVRVAGTASLPTLRSIRHLTADHLEACEACAWKLMATDLKTYPGIGETERPTLPEFQFLHSLRSL